MIMGNEDIRSLSREDLFLLMDQYKNTVELNTILLEQLKQILGQQSDIVRDQKHLCDSINSVLEKMGVCNIHIAEVQKDFLTQQLDGKLQCSKDHSGITLKIYAVYGLFGTIAASTIWLAIQLTSKFALIESMARASGVIE